MLHQGGVITTEIALKEMKQSSMQTGRFTNITDQDIKDAGEAPPPWEQPPAMPGMPGAGMPGAKPNGAGGAMGAGVPSAGLKAKVKGGGEGVGEPGEKP
jgi:hypothetical protein